MQRAVVCLHHHPHACLCEALIVPPKKNNTHKDIHRTRTEQFVAPLASSRLDGSGLLVQSPEGPRRYNLWDNRLWEPRELRYSLQTHLSENCGRNPWDAASIVFLSTDGSVLFPIGINSISMSDSGWQTQGGEKGRVEWGDLWQEWELLQKPKKKKITYRIIQSLCDVCISAWLSIVAAKWH